MSSHHSQVVGVPPARWLAWRQETLPNPKPGQHVSANLPRWQFLWHRLKDDSIMDTLCGATAPYGAILMRYKGPRPRGTPCMLCVARAKGLAKLATKIPT